jgi:hypothetical protein
MQIVAAQATWALTQDEGNIEQTNINEELRVHWENQLQKFGWCLQNQDVDSISLLLPALSPEASQSARALIEEQIQLRRKPPEVQKSEEPQHEAQSTSPNVFELKNETTAEVSDEKNETVIHLFKNEKYARCSPHKLTKPMFVKVTTHTGSHFWQVCSSQWKTKMRLPAGIHVLLNTKRTKVWIDKPYSTKLLELSSTFPDEKIYDAMVKTWALQQ